MLFSTVEAKQTYFLNADDLKFLPRETSYGGFGTGRAMNFFREEDLLQAAIAKYGEEGYAKKKAARTKRQENKRKREEAQEAAEIEKENQHQAELLTNPKLAKKEAAAKQKAATILKRNEKVAGEPWNLTIVSPENVAGTKATLQIKSLPPTGWPGEAFIDCDDVDSPAYSYGNIHDFKGKSSEADAEMVFETKWKVCGKRHTGKLSVRVQPSDKVPNLEASKENNKDDKAQQEEEEEEALMVTGNFDSGVNDGVRRWSFKGYRSSN